MPSALRCAEIETPNGPAPMTTTSTSGTSCSLPTEHGRALLAGVLRLPGYVRPRKGQGPYPALLSLHVCDARRNRQVYPGTGRFTTGCAACSRPSVIVRVAPPMGRLCSGQRMGGGQRG